MISALLFDFDGTIGDTAFTILQTFHRTFTLEGLDDRSDERICATIGLPLKDSFLVLHPEIDSKRADELCVTYRDIYRKEAFKTLKMYPGMAEMLNWLRAQGYKMAVVSSKRTELIAEMVQALRIRDLFDCLIGEDLVRHKKPAPDMALLALQKLGITNPATAVVIGDSAYDIAMGREAHTHTIWASYGYGQRAAVLKEGPEKIVENPAMIKDALEDF